jgi:hypothetical protein
MFTIAEIALSVGRVSWPTVLQHVDSPRGLAHVDETLARLDTLRTRLGVGPAALAAYASRAIEEARRCLTS